MTQHFARSHRSTPPTFPLAVFAGLLVVAAMLAVAVQLS